VLEYCANCGKTIDRFLIVSTLRNEAVAYLRLHQLNKAYDYMEAVLWNMGTYLNPSSAFEVAKPQSRCYKQLAPMAYKKLSIAVYSL
jgi:hypothetical protein